MALVFFILFFFFHFCPASNVLLPSKSCTLFWVGCTTLNGHELHTCNWSPSLIWFSTKHFHSSLPKATVDLTVLGFITSSILACSNEMRAHNSHIHQCAFDSKGVRTCLYTCVYMNEVHNKSKSYPLRNKLPEVQCSDSQGNDFNGFETFF